MKFKRKTKKNKKFSKSSLRKKPAKKAASRPSPPLSRKDKAKIIEGKIENLLKKRPAAGIYHSFRNPEGITLSRARRARQQFFLRQ